MNHGDDVRTHDPGDFRRSGDTRNTDATPGTGDIRNTGGARSTGDTRDPDTYAIIGAALAVHGELGCGFLEGVYRAALRIEFHRRGIPFEGEVPLPIRYAGQYLPLGYRADFVCYASVLVEVKALGALGPIEQAQAINYLRASGLHRALLLNFGTQSLQCRRVVLGAAELRAAHSGRGEG